MNGGEISWNIFISINRTYSSGPERKLEASACAYCASSEIIGGQNAEDSLLSGTPPVKRLRGMEGARDFPQPPTRSNGDDGQVVYLPFTSLVHGSRSGGEKRPVPNSQGEILPLIDSSNSHTTSCRDDLAKVKERVVLR